MAGHNKVLGGGGFHHIAMRVHDFDASVKFYTEVLGFTVKTTWGNPERRLALLDTGDGNYIEISSGGSAEPRPEGVILHYALRTDNVDAAIERARAAGAPITIEPKDVTFNSVPPTPVRIGFCKGPDGELIEFFKNDLT
ncbi:MAG: VOC family protein [Chloroflexi bacterium]|nr:VOC family protein [Chloroflexota bacterium]